MEGKNRYKRLKLLTKAFFLRSREGEAIPVSEEEVHTLIGVGTESGMINEEEGEMIRGIFDLKATLVREVMVPRTDIMAIESGSSVDDLITLIRENAHSRIPVFKDTVDNITGVVHAKDILTRWQGTGNTKVDYFVRSPFIVPETKNIEDLLREFKKKGTHIAIVVDEYGGTSGIITIEDIIEEIVGEIRDEYDIEEISISAQPDGSVIVDAKLDIDELASHFKMDIPKDKFETVGGLVTFLSGRVPTSGDVIEYENLRFTVKSADEKKIHSILVKTLTAEDKEKSE